MPEDLRKTVLFSCPFVPAEWIAAHGLHPKRILPGSTGERTGNGQGVCPYAQAYLLQGMKADDAAGIVFTTTCDQMRRVSEQSPGVSAENRFLMHVPTTWQTLASGKIYRSELIRLGRFLQGLGGRAPSNEGLAQVMIRYQAARNKVLDARPLFSARGFSEALAAYYRGETVDPEGCAKVPGSEGNRVPLALVGGPLLAGQFDLFDLVEEAGGTIVLDATTSGERTLPAPFKRRDLHGDPMSVLADSYFGSIPDAFQRPNTLLYQWLKDKLEERQVKGIIFRHYTWCDTWHGEMQRMKEWAKLPFLSINTADDRGLLARTVSRIQSFLEVLK